MQVGEGGIALDDVIEALRSDSLAGIIVQLRLSAGAHTLTDPMRFDESIVASEVSFSGDAGSVIRLPAAVAGRRLQASNANNGTLRAAFVLNSTLKLRLEGMTLRGGAASHGVAAVVIEHQHGQSDPVQLGTPRVKPGHWDPSHRLR